MLSHYASWFINDDPSGIEWDDPADAKQAKQVEDYVHGLGWCTDFYEEGYGYCEATHLHGDVGVYTFIKGE